LGERQIAGSSFSWFNFQNYSSFRVVATRNRFWQKRFTLPRLSFRQSNLSLYCSAAYRAGPCNLIANS